MGIRRMATWALVGGVIVAGAVGALAFVQGSWAPWHGKVLFTAMLVVAAAVQRTVAGVIIERAVFARGSVVGVAAAFGAVALWLVLVWVPYSAWQSLPGGWSDFGLQDSLTRLAGTLSVLAVTMLHAGSLLTLRVSGAGVRAGRAATIGLACVAAAGFALLFWTADNVLDAWAEDLVRLLAAMLVLAGAGTVATPLVARLESQSRRQSEERMLDVKRASARVECPRCGASGTLRAGADGACASCGLKMRIELEEPRCACGYLLYGLKDGVCPECGASAP